MPRNRAIRQARGALGNRGHVGNLTLVLGRAGGQFAAPNRAIAPQVRCQFALQDAPRLQLQAAIPPHRHRHIVDAQRLANRAERVARFAHRHRNVPLLGEGGGWQRAALRRNMRQ